MEKMFSLALTLTAYSDTFAGMWLRLQMVRPVRHFDPGLADYIVLFLRF